MANCSDNSSVLVDLCRNLMKFSRLIEIVDCPMSSSIVDQVILGRINIVRFQGVGNFVSELFVGIEFPILGIHEFVLKTGWFNWAISTLRTNNVNVPASLVQRNIEMADFAEPKPSCLIHCIHSVFFHVSND
jgi:hypothetical protein